MFVVAGVSGHVGSVVAKELISRKHGVKVIVRDAAKGATWSKQGAEVAVGSLQDPAFLTNALRGAGGFFTLLPTDFTTKDVYASQTKLADAIAGAVEASGVPHVVLLSSVGADLPTGTGPIKGLHYLENALRPTGTTLTSIRAGSFQENVGNMVQGARMNGTYPNFTPSADAPMPMVATRDIGVLAAEALIAHPAKSEVIDLQGPVYTVRQVAERLGKALGKKLQVVDVPQSNWVGAMEQSGMPKPIAQAFAEMYGAFANGSIRPKGDRMVQGRTQLDDVIKGLIS